MAADSSDLATGGLIRRGAPGDAMRLAALDRLTSASPRSEEQYAAGCRREGTERALVYEQAGELAGFVVYACVLDEGSIHNIAVDPGRQGRGIGRALVLAALEIMRNEGKRICLLEVRESNAAARGLYEALGFRTDGRRRDYYPTAAGREDALLMSRQL